MTDTNKAAAEPSTGERITTSTEQDSVVVSFDRDGNSEVSSTGESMRQEFNSEGEALSPEELAELEADGDDDKAAEGDGEKSEPEDEGDKDEDLDAGEELPEWDDASEEVSAQYDAKYITQDEDGGDVLNFEAFNAEFAKDRGEGKRDLNPGTRKYLKARFGISDKIIDSHLQGVLAQEREAASFFHSQFGSDAEDGKKNYDAMFAWATSEAGYTAEQKARYNAAMKAGGEAALEQIELLKTRYLSKNGGKLPSGEDARQSSKIGLKSRKERGVSPPKSATSGATTSSAAVQPFANAEEHRHAQNAALKLTGKERTDKLAEVRTRLQASDFWKR